MYLVYTFSDLHIGTVGIIVEVGWIKLRNLELLKDIY